MTDPYRRYAAIYDRTGQDRFGAALARVTLEQLNQHGFVPGAALDLATGTGAAAITLASAGIEVTGIDRSREMLREARRKADERSLPIEWRASAMDAFSSPQRVDLVTCFFDSLNYLLEPDLVLSCFTSVARALVPGGWFVFDVNTIGRFETDWNRTTQVAYEDDDLLCLFRSTYDPETRVSPLVLTVFERDAAQRSVWRRWDEEHIERGYQLADISGWLSTAGFEVEAVAAFNETLMEVQGPADDTSERALFFARYSPPDAKIPA